MKKIVIFCLMILIAISSSAQTPVPNYGFENWVIINNEEVPVGWSIRDTSTTKTTDMYAGNYAARLENIFLANDTLLGLLSTMPPDSSGGFQPAFAVSVRHTTLNGYYKYSPQNGDSCQFIAFLYKDGFNPLWDDIVAYGWICEVAANSYSPFTLNMIYLDSIVIPDSAYIDIAAYKRIDFIAGITDLDPLGNSVLYVDNISFDGFISGVNNIPGIIKRVNVFPNPASNIITIDMYVEESNYNINLYDLNGRLIKAILNKKLAGHQQISVNVENVPNGNYLLMISNKKGYSSKSVSILK